MGRGVSPRQGISLVSSFDKYLLSEVPTVLSIGATAVNETLSWSLPSHSSDGTLAGFRTPGAACEVCRVPSTKVLIPEVFLQHECPGWF